MSGMARLGGICPLDGGVRSAHAHLPLRFLRSPSMPHASPCPMQEDATTWRMCLMAFRLENRPRGTELLPLDEQQALPIQYRTASSSVIICYNKEWPVRLIAMFFALLAPLSGHAFTYAVQTSNYNNATPYVACPAGGCVNYTTAMSISGSFTVAAALPANMPLTEISSSVTAYTFNDGVVTYASGGPLARVYSFIVSTDGVGQVNGARILLEPWVTGALPHTVGDYTGRMQFFDNVFSGTQYFRCSSVGTSPSGQADTCLTGTIQDIYTSSASGVGVPVWSFAPDPVVLPAAVASVPTTSPAALLVLMAALGVAAFVFMRSAERRAH